jgi:hypothetical protein
MLQAVVVLVIIIISLLVTVVSLVLKQVGHILYFNFPVSVSILDPDPELFQNKRTQTRIRIKSFRIHNAGSGYFYIF